MTSVAYVLELDVAVHDEAVVAVLDGLADLREDNARVVLLQAAVGALLEQIVQRAAVDVLQNEENGLAHLNCLSI